MKLFSLTHKKSHFKVGVEGLLSPCHNKSLIGTQEEIPFKSTREGDDSDADVGDASLFLNILYSGTVTD